MTQLRSTFFSLMLISSAFAVTACGPQAPAETEPAPSEQNTVSAYGKCDKPGRTYVSRDQTECLSITWSCPAGQQQFLDSCGCGCE